MNAKQQRIAIAQACGIVKQPNSHSSGALAATGEFVVIPDYLNDLNAMRTAYHTMQPDQQTEFVRWLRLTVMQSPCGITHPGQLINATAAQRAESFLRSLNLWTNS